MGDYRLAIASKKNREILGFLKVLAKDHPVAEFESNLRAVDEALERLLAQNVKLNEQSGLIFDDFYVQLVKFDELLQGLKNKSSLMRVLTSNRLRKDLELLNAVVFAKFKVFISIHERPRTNSTIIDRERGASLTKLPSTEFTREKSFMCFDDSNPTGPRKTIAHLNLLENEESRQFWLDSFGSAAFMISHEEFIKGFQTYIKSPLPEPEAKLMLQVLDNSSTNFVNVYKFSEYLKGFGPMKKSIENMKKIFCSDWFHGFLSGEETFRLLEDQEVGTFLVRFSRSRPGSFALAFVEPTRSEVLQVEINSASADTFGFNIREASTERYFKSLHDIIIYYQQYFVKPFTCDFLSESWFHGDLSSAEAIDLLSPQPVGAFLVRFSKELGAFAISYVAKTSAATSVKHALVRKTPLGYQEQSSERVYATLSKFIEAYGALFTLPHPNTTCEAVRCVKAIKGELVQKQEEELAKEQALAESNKLANKSEEKKGSKVEQKVAPKTLLFAPDNQDEVKAGTFDKLVEQLTATPSSDFASTFLFTYRKFAVPHQLLELLVKFFTQFRDPDSVIRPQTKVKRLRIVNFLKLWLEKYWHDFRGDNVLLDDVMRVIDMHILPSEGERLAEQLRSCIARHTTGAELPVTFDSDPPKPIVPRVDKFVLGDIDPEEVARQLTLIDFEMFKRLEPCELLNMNWMKEETKYALSPNVMKMINRFNLVSQWLASEVVRESDAKKRVVRLEHLIKIGVALLQLKNFNGAMMVFAALNCTPIDRLKRTYAEVSIQGKKVVADIRVLFAPDSSSKAYRQTLRRTSPPFIPYVGLSLSDLVFMETGNPDYWESIHGYINFKKCELLSKVLRDIQSAQVMPYNLWPVASIRQFLQTLEPLSERAMLDESYRLEPRQVPQPVQP